MSEVKQGEAWSRLTDLRELRNLIAHRAGNSSRIEKHRKTVDRLVKKYNGHLDVEKTPMDRWSEVWISMDLCRRFTNDVEAFLGEVLSDVDALPASKASKSQKE